MSSAWPRGQDGPREIGILGNGHQAARALALGVPSKMCKLSTTGLIAALALTAMAAEETTTPRQQSAEFETTVKQKVRMDYLIY